MNFDAVARWYVWLETIAFGSRLQQRRQTFLPAAQGKRHALILGDGDGRFLAALVRAYPDLQIDCIDASRRMLSLAAQRLPANAHVRFIHADARTFPLTENRYDVVFTHFFLDCFHQADLDRLAAAIANATAAQACWVVSEFCESSRGWRKIYTRAWLSLMYYFFQLAVGLEARRLPNHRIALEAAGFRKHSEQVTWDGLLVSECWRR